MSIRFWTRFCFGALCVAVLATATPAFAKHTEYLSVRSYSPSGRAKLSGTTTVKAAVSFSAVRSFRLSNRRTRFMWDFRTDNGDGTGTIDSKRISRNEFVRRKPKECMLVWNWKKDSRGQKYRYVTEIEAVYLLK